MRARTGRREVEGLVRRSSATGEGGFTLVELLIVVAIIAILMAIAIPSLLKSRTSANEVNAAAVLRTILNMESVLRQSDLDSNTVQDYWTGDVSGFYRLADGGGNPIRMIDIAVAKADLAPLPAGAAPRPFLTAAASPVPTDRSGYEIQSMTVDADGNPLQVDGADTDANAWENLTRFAFVAIPSSYRVTGVNTFIMREDGVVFGRDPGNNTPILIWPGADPSSAVPPWRIIQ